MVLTSKKYNKYYRVGNRLRVHGYNKKGDYRITGWENIEDLKGYNVPEKEGKYKIVEWVFNYKPTKDDRPSSHRNWETRIQVPDGLPESDVRDMADKVLAELTNWEMVETSDVSVKEGKDIIKYSKYPDTKWMVVDTVRPQYKYPSKRRWGNYVDLE